MLFCPNKYLNLKDEQQAKEIQTDRYSMYNEMGPS